MSVSEGVAAPQRAPFALLISVYHRDTSELLLTALNSCVREQTLIPAEIVLVKDGAVSRELAAAIAEFVTTSPVPVQIVTLPENRGLAAALNAGLERVSCEFAARMDADDVSVPDRFATQWQFLQQHGLDLVGTGMAEFVSDPDTVSTLRVPPVGAERIRAHARTHAPFNHPTMMYRVATVQAVGGYQEMGTMEDYWLAVRMLLAGAKVDNIARPLVKYRVGQGAYSRRGGWQVLRTEWRMQRKMLQIRFISPVEFVRNCLIKMVYRLLPGEVKRFLFRKFVAGGLPGDKKSAPGS
ncbi:glycosyltransferase [Canibacter zhuwentaonis]|uniref:glycosyltransferase n=1 Tax=Canibacter zhuwentaonis TaxID=2837491 RepID=UPI0032B5709C